MPSTRDGGMNLRRPKKLIITVNDVMQMMACHRSTAHRILKTLKHALGKQDHHLITITEFAQAFGLDEEAIMRFLK